MSTWLLSSSNKLTKRMARKFKIHTWAGPESEESPISKPLPVTRSSRLPRIHWNPPNHSLSTHPASISPPEGWPTDSQAASCLLERSPTSLAKSANIRGWSMAVETEVTSVTELALADTDINWARSVHFFHS